MSQDSMVGNKNRKKGHAFENQVARELSDIWYMANRNFQERGGAKDGPDVENTPYWIECKYGKVPRVLAAIQQALDETDGRPILVAFRQIGKPAYVIQPFAHWKKIANKAVLFDRAKSEMFPSGSEPWVGRLDYEEAIKESEDGSDEPSGP